MGKGALFLSVSRCGLPDRILAIASRAMKYLFPIVVVLGLTGVFIACGGTEDEEKEPSALENCETSCGKYAECSDETGSDSSAFDEEACKDTCKEFIDETTARGCKAEFEAGMSCSLENFSCAPAAGSGEGPCDAENEDLTLCLQNSSGSGS